MNVVIDTNVLLSAALRDRLPELVVRYVATSEECRWVVTAPILQEYLEVARRPKFGLTAEVIREWDDLVITGDNDLLQARASLPTRIVSVAAFVAEFKIR